MRALGWRVARRWPCSAWQFLRWRSGSPCTTSATGRRGRRKTSRPTRSSRWPPATSSYNRPRMIDREQVLHVARLARLRLDDDEVETMSRELSGILDHIE